MDEHSLECLDFYRIRELLASYALSALGRELALTVQPLARRALIDRWYDQVRELQAFMVDHGLPPFAGISDVRQLVQNCAPPLKVSVEDVARIGDTLRGTHSVATYLSHLPESATELSHLASRVGDFAPIAARIRTVIDDRGQVRDDASPKLARLREEIRAANTAIHDTVDRLLRDAAVRRLLQYTNHTFHNDRLVLPLRAECRGRLQGIIHRTSDSGATIYVEPAQAVELNNQISNLRIAEDEEINRLMWELTHEIYLNADEIVKTLDALAVLDLVAAKVRWAEQFDMHCPALLDDAILDVRQARHPLLLQLVKERRAAGDASAEVVPIDYRLGEDFDLLVITGPNTGGKTVTLKTIGLLSMMIQAGLPIPAAPSSRAGLLSNVLIDIGDEQSMQQSLSTFSAHMKRLLDMLKRAGPKTLVLIDELGAGTDPDEGAAIGRAVLDELIRLQARCIVTTHLGALKSFALTRERAENGSVEFDTETLRPTYHLRIGEAGQSNAIEIAQRLGMPKRLVFSARKNLSHRARAMKSALAGAAQVKREAEQARAAADAARVQASQAENQAAEARQRYERQQQDFQQWVQRVVHLQPGDAVRVRHFDRDGKIVRMRLDQHRAEVDVGAFSVEVPLGDVLPPQAPPPPPVAPRPKPVAAVVPGQQPRRKPKMVAATVKQQPSASAPPPRPAQPKLPSLTEKQIAALQPGDPIYAKRFHREGTIARINQQKQVAIVTLGLLEVEVPFEGLASAEAGRRQGSGDAGRRGRGPRKRGPRSEPRGGKPDQDSPPASG